MIQPLAHTRSSRATYPRQEHAQSTHERVKGQKSLRQALSRLSGDSLLLESRRARQQNVAWISEFGSPWEYGSSLSELSTTDKGKKRMKTI